MLSPSQIVAIVVGGTIGVVSTICVLHDAWVLTRTRFTPAAAAYATSAIVSAMSFAAFVALLAFVEDAPMPMFAVVFPTYALFAIAAWYKNTPTWHAYAFLAAAAFYWNIAIIENKTIIATATPLLIVHHGFVVLFIKPRTRPL